MRWTGTAAWTLIVVWEWMLGVRPELDGLLIDPCLPSAWTGARMTRAYRGATYEIAIEKPAFVLDALFNIGAGATAGLVASGTGHWKQWQEMLMSSGQSEHGS
jgi:cellobiose phosphorylase